MQKRRLWAYVAGLSALMTACNGNPAPLGAADTDSTSDAGAPALVGAQFVPGQVIVKFKSGAIAPARLAFASANLETSRQLGGGETLYTIGGELTTTAARDSVLETVEALRTRDDVEFAQPNYLYYTTATPNDSLYKDQWNYPAINLPGAWDITTGSSSVVIAVLDTGKMNHPDLSGQFVGGYDFVSDASISTDGDGRDSDATNPGTGRSASHGIHVAGTIAALSNNNSGVAGVCWNCKVLPVRVVSDTGASSADITDGIRWAAGLSIAGVPDNAYPAKVINMSLAGELPCSADPTYQNAINAAYERNISIVVAAGNRKKRASGFVPASCNNVITVAATDYVGGRAPYSNFGATIEVSAPGGNIKTKLHDGQSQDGIRSTIKNPGGSYAYSGYQGTSMAAPHVSGVIGLMLSRNSALTPTQIVNKLKRTARAISTEKCRAGCGAGLIDADAALR